MFKVVMQLSPALSGYGLCIRPSFMASNHQDLVRILPERVHFPRFYCLVTHMDVRAPARAKAIVTFLHETVRQHRELFLPSKQ